MAVTFEVTNLASDQAGVAAIQDPNLVNAWGLAIDHARGSFSVADGGSGMATQYHGDVHGSAFVKDPLEITIPGGDDEGSKPTGEVFNRTSDFVISDGTSSGPAELLFATETGHIVGWNPDVPANSTQGQIAVTTEGAIYKGLALGRAGGSNYLYATDFHNRQIDVFDADFNPVTLDGSFTDRKIPDNFAPFNIQRIGGRLYVTYAKQDADAEDDVPGQGNGFVDVFDMRGHLEQRLIRHGQLNSPWGMELAPGGWGKYSFSLLVGNFGDGKINAFNPVTGRFIGSLRDNDHQAIHIDGLWGLAFGDGQSAGDRRTLYFTAGPDDEAHGLFGKVAVHRDDNVAQSGDSDLRNLAAGVVAVNPPIGRNHVHFALANDLGTRAAIEHAVLDVTPAMHLSSHAQFGAAVSRPSRGAKPLSPDAVDALFDDLGTNALDARLGLALAG